MTYSKIYIKHWLSFKPYASQAPTDRYYIKLCNEIKVLLHKRAFLKMYLDDEGIIVLSCILVSYFEDIISETNIWGAFVQKHSKLYGKKLPFYSTEQYYDGEINEQDVSFLIWYCLSTFEKETFISPYRDAIGELAEDVMEVLDKAYEYAPENEVLKTCCQLDPDETDFYKVRLFINTVLLNTWLFYTDSLFRYLDSKKEVMEARKGTPDLATYLHHNKDQFLLGQRCSLFALKGSEWAAEILTESHPLYTDLYSISPKIFSYFLYKGQNETHITLEHIASGKTFLMTKESYEHSDWLTKIDDILLIGIIKWRDEWWFSGIHVISDYTEELILKQKASEESLQAVAFLDHAKHGREALQKQEDAFLAFNNNRHIAFMPSAEIESFFRNCMEHYMEFHDVSKKRPEKASEKSKAVKLDIDLSEMEESGLVFFNPKGGLEVAIGINSAFPAKENPWYDEDNSEAEFFRLLISKEFSTELARYCIDNYGESLPFLRKDENKRYLENIDFLLRFWKRGVYHTEPAISYAK